MNRHILFLLSEEARWASVSTLFDSEVIKQNKCALVMLQSGIRIGHSPCQETAIVQEHAINHGIRSGFSQISYRDLLEKIFSSDSVIVL